MITNYTVTPPLPSSLQEEEGEEAGEGEGEGEEATPRASMPSALRRPRPPLTLRCTH